MIFTQKNTLVLIIFLLLLSLNGWSQNIPPELNATGDQAYCPSTNINIVTSFSIIPGDKQIDAVFVQISENYSNSDDSLILTSLASHPNVSQSWDTQEGKLTLEAVTKSSTAYIDLVAAVYDVVFNSNSSTSIGEKHFSFTVDEANYLPSTGHYYEYIEATGITWNNAKTASSLKKYYDLQGYLATITSLEEAILAGEQAPGQGWIGGSDDEEEGVWRWVTGPEGLENGGLGRQFWQGREIASGGTTTAPDNFAYWNDGEPNQYQGLEENYAHVYENGKWNDYPNYNNDINGYIVEYGGMPGDPVLNISASTSVFIPEIIPPTTPAELCGGGIINLEVTAAFGDALWYDEPAGGNLKETGPTYSPDISETTTYYVQNSESVCVPENRTPIEAIIKTIPTILAVSGDTICEGEQSDLTATASSGIINWYDTLTGGDSLETGPSYSPTISETTDYYVDTTDYGCTTATRTKVTLNVNPLPEFDIESDPTKVICINSPESITLSVVNAKDKYIYEWFYEGVFFSSGPKTSISQGGIYTAVATNSFDCTFEQTITINESIIAPITDQDVYVDDANNTVTLKTGDLEIDDYEYFISGENGISEGIKDPTLQEVIFKDVAPGIHTIHVNNIYDCGNVDLPVSVIGYPKFFSPNGDGENEHWNVKGVNSEFYTYSLVSVFDRFGRFITQIELDTDGWDGYYNGEPLPATDYWFTAELIDNQGVPSEKKGHFSLIR